MSLLFRVKEPEFLSRSGSVDDIQVQFQYMGRETNPAVDAFYNATISVTIAAADNATQIETKIRDAVIADALSRFGLTVAANNVFQNAWRRG